MSELPAFRAIAAIDEEGGLGLRGDLPWHLPADLKHFAKTTTRTEDPSKQNAVIMGRVTCQSIPDKYWPLSGRRNVVVSRDPNFSIEGAEVFTDLATALRETAPKVESIFVVGGGQIYSRALELDACSELLLTRIHRRFGCDTFFPPFRDRYELREELARGEHEGLAYTIERWTRKAGPGAGPGADPDSGRG